VLWARVSHRPNGHTRRRAFALARAAPRKPDRWRFRESSPPAVPARVRARKKLGRAMLHPPLPRSGSAAYPHLRSSHSTLGRTRVSRYGVRSGASNDDLATGGGTRGFDHDRALRWPLARLAGARSTRSKGEERFARFVRRVGTAAGRSRALRRLQTARGPRSAPLPDFALAGTRGGASSRLDALRRHRGRGSLR
jgi:hypothetical protein